MTRVANWLTAAVLATLAFSPAASFAQTKVRLAKIEPWMKRSR